MATRKVVHADSCPACTRAATDPFRAWEGGKIVLGCVDHFHTGHLVTPSASAAWHARPEAKTIRANTKRMRDGWVTERAA